MSINLTDAEREVLAAGALYREAYPDGSTHYQYPDDVLETVVERIIAARLEQQREDIATAIRAQRVSDRAFMETTGGIDEDDIQYLDGLELGERIVREYGTKEQS